MAFPTTILLVVTAAASTYALAKYLSATRKLQTYERQGKKAAEWSNTVETLLWDTQRTFGVGLAASAVSVLSSLNLLLKVIGPSSGWFPYHAAWAGLMAATQHYSSQHMHAFWHYTPKVPLMREWNAALEESEEVVRMLDALAVAWSLIAVLKLVGL